MEKGTQNGECNRKSCSNKKAIYYNLSTLKFYCESCANIINHENESDSHRLFGGLLCVIFDIKEY